MAGATPKDTMSERLSYSLPNGLAVLVPSATAVQHVEDAGDEHGDARVFEPQVDGGHDRVKTSEKCAGRERLGSQ